MPRADWDETWMMMAITMSKRSRCVGRQVGAVIVDKMNRPISTGYNGPPAAYPVGAADSCSGFCERAQTGDRTPTYENCVSIHAEANAMIFADRSRYAGGTIYISDPPCWDCAKMIANSGIARVRWREAEAAWRNISRSTKLLTDCGLVVSSCPRSTGS